MSAGLAGSLVGNAWRVWANEWAGRGENVPALHHLRNGAGDDAFFAVDRAEGLAETFKRLNQQQGELRFVLRGSWALPPLKWLGHWSVFSVSRSGFRSEGFEG